MQLLDSPRRRSALARFAADKAGAVAVITGLVATVLMGFAGLAVDVSLWQLTRRNMQGAADQAAFSAAIAASAGASAIVEAKAVTASRGFVDGRGGVAVAVNHPPTQGSHAGDSSAWEVMVTKPKTTFFAKIFAPSSTSLMARAVALAGTGSGTCMLALNKTAADALLFDNNASMSNPSCSLYSNSSSPKAIDCNNNCTIMSSTYAVGKSVASNNGQLRGAVNATGASPAADPYANVSAGTPGACTRTTAVTGGSISPGHYCGGIMLNGSTLNMASGVYYVDKQFGVQNGSTLNANPPGGVTIIINGSYCIGYGDCQAGHGIGDNSTLNITAQSTGPYAGIAIFGPRSSTSTVTQEFSDNSRSNIQGVVYFPSQAVHFDNNATFSSSLCTQVIADTIHMENNANMSVSCSGTGVQSIGSQPRVAE